MKNILLILGIVIALVVGGGVGYSLGKGAGMESVDAKKLQDSVAMMKEQSAAIQKMGEMMKSGGAAMQATGMKYNDQDAVSTGKDLETVGAKYMGERTAQEGSGAMKQMMK